MRNSPSPVRLLLAGHRLLGQTILDLVENARKIVRLGTEIARMVPLELRLELAADPPVSVPEVVVDHRICGLEIDGLLELAHRFVIAPQAVVSPAETVDDIAVARLQIDRTPQHAEGLVEIDALVDP